MRPPAAPDARSRSHQAADHCGNLHDYACTDNADNAADAYPNADCCSQPDSNRHADHRAANRHADRRTANQYSRAKRCASDQHAHPSRHVYSAAAHGHPSSDNGSNCGHCRLAG